MTTTDSGSGTGFDRRSLLKGGAALGVSTLLFSGGTQALASLAHAAPGKGDPKRLKAPNNGGYGRLKPVRDRTTGRVLLHLPDGFTYASFGHEASYASALGLAPAIGSDRHPTPGRHDGMAAFATDVPGQVRLVRNHEQGYSPTDAAQEPEDYTGRDYDRALIGDPEKAYDPRAAGGTTTLTFDTRSLRLTDSFVSLNGTSVNCAGGPTPWGTWLSCEETVNGPENGAAFTQKHGYVFEVPARGGPVARPEPYRAMGRFAHEAVAVDPGTGIVYETEDDGNTSGFYRFTPATPGDLRDGRLEMLAVAGRPNLLTYRSDSAPVGTALPVSWVPIEDPDPQDITREAVFAQGAALGGAHFARLEGAWWDSGSVFFNATSGGDAGLGQVWEYRPAGGADGTLTKVFESPSAKLLDAPDNICVSPRGGLVLCEDGDGEQYVRGLDVDGEIFDLALNAIGSDNEFAGACFSPDGSTMFVNVQTPGVSFAIQGPWQRGAL